MVSTIVASASMRWVSRRSARARSANDSAPHAGCAARARCTAASTSSVVAVGISTMVAPVPGLRTGSRDAEGMMWFYTAGVAADRRTRDRRHLGGLLCETARAARVHSGKNEARGTLGGLGDLGARYDGPGLWALGSFFVARTPRRC